MFSIMPCQAGFHFQGFSRAAENPNPRALTPSFQPQLLKLKLQTQALIKPGHKPEARNLNPQTPNPKP